MLIVSLTLHVPTDQLEVEHDQCWQDSTDEKDATAALAASTVEEDQRETR